MTPDSEQKGGSSRISVTRGDEKKTFNHQQKPQMIMEKWFLRKGRHENLKVFEMKLRWCSAESRNKISVIQISEFYDQTTLMYISPAIGI